MGCLLKPPLIDSKGVVTFTTQEQRVLNSSVTLQNKLVELKKHYIIGLHFNWHDYKFKPDTRFDFFMAGEGDLRPVNDTPFHLFPMDACNFTPEIYKPTTNDKFWDVLIVGSPVYFKRPEVALQSIRKLFDVSGRPCRVLYICPIPTYKKSDERTAFYNIREYYEALFTKEERNWFTLLTTHFNSPFPFDRHTLSNFFRNSRVFLHCATEERRCRIAAYAWCAGLPVVAYPSVASVLPSQLQIEPGYFQVDNDADYASKIILALDSVKSFDPESYRQTLSESYTIANLDRKLASLFDELKVSYKGKLLSRNLDIRLGWHHQNIGGPANGLLQPLDEFINQLEALVTAPMEDISALTEAEYPERILAGEYTNHRQDEYAMNVLKRSPYLKPQSLWCRVYNLIKLKLLKN